MSNYLFTLTITPVQSFITQARKTKDLFAGSEILSKIIKETINKATEDYRAKKIFPQDTKIVSNKFVLDVETTEKNIKELGDKLEQFIKNKLYKDGLKIFIDEIFKINIQDSCDSFMIDDDFIKNQFKPQLCNFFQVFWVAVEYDKDKYQESYRKLEQNLGAVKNLRVFNQFEQMSGRKCSVCGERNGLFYNREKPHAFIIDKAIRLKTNQIEESETLCAVCFVKRFYSSTIHFDSTQEIKMIKGIMLWFNLI